MRAAWYERNGPPDVLVVGERADPVPGPGAVRVPAQALAAAVEDVTAHLLAGTLTHPVAARYPLAEVAQAHRAVERGGHIGKILLDLA